MENAIKIFSLTAVVILLMGLVWNLSPRLPRFPGDLIIDKFGFTIYIPVISGLAISVVLTILSNFLTG